MTGKVLTASFTYVAQIWVLKNGVPYAALLDLEPGGSITVDVTAQNLRSLSFTCVDPGGTIIIDGPNALLGQGVELQVFVGYLRDSGPELYSAGIFGITKAEATNEATAPGPAYAIEAVDRSARVANALFNDSFVINNGTSVEAAVRSILKSQAPWCTQIRCVLSQHVIAQQIYSPGDNPMTEIVSICASAGLVCYFDVNGVFIIENAPIAKTSPNVMTITSGPKNIASKVVKSISSNPGYNGVIITGASLSNGTVVSGAVYDMDPASPTYAAGPYGYRPAPPVQDSIASTVGQCLAAAKAVLPQILGMTRTLGIDHLPVPFLAEYDFVYIGDPATGVAGTYIVQGMTIPLDQQIQALTVVPLGSPLSALTSIGNTPSIAAVGPTSPIYQGGANYASYGSTYGFGATGGTPNGIFGGRHGGAGVLFSGLRLDRLLRAGGGGFRLANGHLGGLGSFEYGATATARDAELA